MPTCRSSCWRSKGPPQVDLTIHPQADGKLVLPAAEATIHGASPHYESGDGKKQHRLLANPKDYVDWQFQSQKPGVYRVEIIYSCQSRRRRQRVRGCDGRSIAFRSVKIDRSWSTFATEELGTLKIEKAGSYTLGVKPKAEPKWKVIGLQAVILTPLQK